VWICTNLQQRDSHVDHGGQKLTSGTDTEVIGHLVEDRLREGKDLPGALEKTVEILAGAHAILVMARREPGTIVAARAGNAGGVVVGYGHEESYLASDLPALLPHTRRVVFLDNGDVVRVTAGRAVYRNAGRAVERAPQQIAYDPVSAAKGSFKH